MTIRKNGFMVALWIPIIVKQESGIIFYEKYPYCPIEVWDIKEFGDGKVSASIQAMMIMYSFLQY